MGDCPLVNECCRQRLTLLFVLAFCCGCEVFAFLCFARELLDRMAYEEFGERRVIISLMVLLYNFTTSTVGQNMILNSFMSRTEGFHSYGTIPETANNVFLEALE